MAHTRLVLSSLIAALAVVALPGRAAADIRLTPFGGVTFIENERQTTFGASITGGGLFGIEFDAARVGIGTIREIPGVELQAHATTFMGNVVIRMPVGPIQPYATGGIGIVRVTGEVDVAFAGDIFSASADDVGWNVGGGIYIFPAPNIGIRGDVRRFQTGDLSWTDIGGLDDLPLPQFDFWRASVGLTFRF
jgi:opacity protein-like surface antigen